jgi:anti-sigma regulatory factor (Ser/Thr protein kinase)
VSGATKPSPPATLRTPRPEPGLSLGSAAAWSLTDRLKLGCLPSAVPCARLHTRAILAERGLAHLNDTAELVISELATNALQATRAASLTNPLTIHLHANETCLCIGVWDALPQPPAQHPSDLDADHGRGLHIVAALSHHWGTHHPAQGGKIVYALIPIAS